MKRSFIKALWGIHDHQGRRLYKRRTKIDNDIQLCLHNKYQEPFITYVFGEDNYKFLVDNGFNCKLIDKKPIVWDIDTQQFRHKFEAFKLAAEEFDEFVFTDWDMMFIKPLPKDFWDKMYEKEEIQAILRIYKHPKVSWRNKDCKDCSRIVPSGSFIYIRRKSIAEELIKYWEMLNKPWGEEVVMAKYIDDKMNNGFNMEEYWRRFEPIYFRLQPMYEKEKLDTKICIVEHVNERGINWYLNQMKNNNYIDWLQKEKRIYK